MSEHVPDFINPFRAAEGKHSIAGRVEFARMGRLSKAVENRDGAADISLSFAVDNQGIPHVSGWVRCEAVLVCQRCLEPMTVPVDVELNLGIVRSDEEAGRLPGDYDPLVAGTKPVAIAEMIEDEILLALPAIPRHDDAACEVTTTGKRDTVTEAEAGGESSANPFSVLAKLKAKH